MFVALEWRHLGLVVGGVGECVVGMAGPGADRAAVVGGWLRGWCRGIPVAGPVFGVLIGSGVL